MEGILMGECENEVELIEHKIVVDKYIELTLKIPKVMNVLELGGLMEKSKKLMALTSRGSEHHNISMGKPTTTRKVYSTRNVYTDEMNQFVIEMRRDNQPIRLIELGMKNKFGVEMTSQKLYAQMGRLKKLGKL